MEGERVEKNRKNGKEGIPSKQRRTCKCRLKCKKCGQEYEASDSEDGKKDDEARLAHGCTKLMYACQQGLTGSIVKELRSKPEEVRKRDRSNKSALHYCSGQRDLVAAASVAMAAPELIESADEDGFTPLHLAVIQGNLSLVNLLLANKADVNALDGEGHSVVHWAIVCGEIEALRSVLTAGADVSTPDINGGSPLHYAAQMCGTNFEGKSGQASSKLALDILNILLHHPKSSVDLMDKDGRQPLLWAASAGSEKAVLALVKAGARIESCDKDGLTALHCAASRGHTECIDALISLCGAPTDLIDSNGCTALHYAVTLGHADATALLLDLEADPNRQDRKGRTPAHCGCAKGQFETVKMLGARGANLWLRNARGDLPVHEAALSGRRELIHWLLEQQPKHINTTSNDGRTLLHIAATNDSTDNCKMLLDFGADVNSIYRTSRNVVMTPLDCALQKGFRSTAKFLQLHGGLPASKLHLSGRKVNALNDQQLVTPLKFTDKSPGDVAAREGADKQSKHYVVYVKQSESDESAQGASKGVKKRRASPECTHHKRQRYKRRTSSCSDTFRVAEKDEDMGRSKSNLEIRRRRKSREKSYSTSEESDSDASVSSDVSFNEYKKRRSRKHCKKYNVSIRHKSPTKHDKKHKSPKMLKKTSTELADEDDGQKDEEGVVKEAEAAEKSELKSETDGGVKDKAGSRPGTAASDAEKKRPQSARVTSAQRRQKAKEQSGKLEATAEVHEEPSEEERRVGQEKPHGEEVGKAEVTESVGARQQITTQAEVHIKDGGQDGALLDVKERNADDEDAQSDITFTLDRADKAEDERQMPSDMGEICTPQGKDAPTEEVIADTPKPPDQPSAQDDLAARGEEAKSFAVIDVTASKSDDKGVRGSFTVLQKSDSKADLGRPSSFKVLDESALQTGGDRYDYTSDEEQKLPERDDSGAKVDNGRRKKLKKRLKNSKDSTLDKSDDESAARRQQRDQDSGFEPSPRVARTKIPTPRAAPRKETAFTTLDSGGGKLRPEGRKLGDQNAVNMTTVTASIQKNIRRYYMERKIFQHLLELKSLQIRSSKVNEAILVKRAVDDYHKSVDALGYETGATLKRYPHKEYTFKNFEVFLYETLKSIQKTGTYNFQNISEVYREAERRLSPDYNQYEKALQCTTKTHRCLHAAHAYTGIPCAAYIPMMNHHTMPKLGFGAYKQTGVGSFYLPKILTAGLPKCGSKVSLELSHGGNKQLIPLPSDKLDSNKRYYVTFTVKGSDGVNQQSADTEHNTDKI
ncbi:inversin-B [Phlebotomus argentipes]|uniref:inversin-B n=1 Tax=Phlebotomus argentipes TaxID=94469 RepID=UPI0028937C17|nr:inversin-B [Phlebotomus argentipes]